jgi:hypothetical protein
MIGLSKVKRECKDDITKIENYEEAINDKVNMWECHHRLELTLDGEFAHTHKELKRLGMYWYRPYFELIFLKQEDHKKLHGEKYANIRSSKMKGKSLTDFGQKLKEHYGITKNDDKNLWSKEYKWYLRHGKCRWE